MAALASVNRAGILLRTDVLNVFGSTGMRLTAAGGEHVQ